MRVLCTQVTPPRLGTTMRTTAIALCAALILLSGAALAAASRGIIVEVISISAAPRGEATRDDATVKLDPRLKPLSKNLRSLFAYESYTFLASERATVAFGEECPFKLPEHFTLEVAPERFDPSRSGMIEMLVTLYREEQQSGRGRGPRPPEREVILRTKIRLKNGGTVLLGGPPIRSGILVMALSARG